MKKLLRLAAVAVFAIGAALGAVRVDRAEATVLVGYQFMTVSYGGALTLSSVFQYSADCDSARSASIAGTGSGYTHTACYPVSGPS